MTKPKYISVNGELVPYDEATVHLLSPAVKYGALVFEGLRAYWNSDNEELYVFRLAEHLERFHRTLRAMRFDVRYTDEALTDTVVGLLRANEVRDDVHLRIAAYVEGDGLYDSTGPIGLMCAAYGRRSGTLETKLTRAGVVSWRRIDDASMPPRLKVAANYHNARLGALEAHGHGYDEPIFLTAQGRVAEGAGSCLMLVRDGQLLTPSVTEGILESVTRRTLLGMASELGIEVVERAVDRTELYFCDEAFFCGTGVEILPVVEIDGQPLGAGSGTDDSDRVGEITRQLWTRYHDCVRGVSDENAEWRTAVYEGER